MKITAIDNLDDDMLEMYKCNKQHASLSNVDVVLVLHMHSASSLLQ